MYNIYNRQQQYAQNPHYVGYGMYGQYPTHYGEYAQHPFDYQIYSQMPNYMVNYGYGNPVGNFKEMGYRPGFNPCPHCAGTGMNPFGGMCFCTATNEDTQERYAAMTARMMYGMGYY